MYNQWSCCCCRIHIAVVDINTLVLWKESSLYCPSAARRHIISLWLPSLYPWSMIYDLKESPSAHHPVQVSSPTNVQPGYTCFSINKQSIINIRAIISIIIGISIQSINFSQIRNHTKIGQSNSSLSNLHKNPAKRQILNFSKLQQNNHGINARLSIYRIQIKSGPDNFLFN